MQRLEKNEVRRGLAELRKKWEKLQQSNEVQVDDLYWFSQMLIPDKNGEVMSLLEFVVRFVYGKHSRRPLKRVITTTPQQQVIKIGFGCQSRVGKDSCCEYMVSKYGGVQISHAKPIYELMFKVQQHLSMPTEKDPELLQLLGMWATNHDPNVWVNKLNETLSHIDNNSCIFVSDVRKKVEWQNLKSKGFTMIRIVRPNRVVDRNPTHCTEIELLDDTYWDHIVVNDGTLLDLYSKLEKCVGYNNN